MATYGGEIRVLLPLSSGVLYTGISRVFIVPKIVMILGHINTGLTNEDVALRHKTLHGHSGGSFSL